MSAIYGRYVRFYNRYAHAIVTATGLLAVVGIWVGVGAVVTNERQDAERAAGFGAILACFDRYAAADSDMSRLVRVASIRKDKATELRDDALNREGRAFRDVVRGIVDESDPKEIRRDFHRLAETLEERARAAAALDRAQEALDRARAENPIPPPPSVFCSSSD